ncbi:MAG TPA: dimethyladenosine transferase [Cyanothece sp. UBA12306]|nr:dimethyladenosine transferase [Cyanothece sp. UBA12306]
MYQLSSNLTQDSLLQEFLDTLPLKYRTIMAIAYFTSSKITDILSLKISDIYPDKIAINHSESEQTQLVPITSLLRPYLTLYLNGFCQQKSEFIFGDTRGEPLQIGKVFRVLNLVARQINLPEIYLFILK